MGIMILDTVSVVLIKFCFVATDRIFPIFLINYILLVISGSGIYIYIN